MIPWIRVVQLCAVWLGSVCIGGEAQSISGELRHVRWPLLDMVMLPDSSSGVLLMVAPNPATVQWEQNTPLVQLGIDPVIALQWVTLARALTQADSSRQTTGAARVTPAL